ncbi:MAG: YeeE/YedE family protein [Beijerinckiaceae bacterium]|nr:YeeE/YedE family protein [Beijerinckiaceae bacterium]
MITDWNPWQALAGGGLIGLSAALLLLSNGKIAGISGIVGRLMLAPGEGAAWRAAFLAGLLSGPLLFVAFAGHWPDIGIDASWPVLLAAGLLVGAGTRWGHGCTSGHGVCGLARLSRRSMVAVATFMAAAIVTVFVVRHGIQP